MEEYVFTIDQDTSDEGPDGAYEGQVELLATSMTATKISEEAPEWEKTTKRNVRLEDYEIGSAPSLFARLIEPKEQIMAHVDKVLELLALMKEDMSDEAEVEIIFSNIDHERNELWQLRKFREKAYPEVLVLVESCIKYYDVTKLNEEKIDCLIDVFNNLKSATLLSTYPKECRKKLMQAGFDIFRPFYTTSNKYYICEKKDKK